MNNLIEPRYLGDGAYASFDGFNIVLTTGHHSPAQADNVICLEPAVFCALVRFNMDLTTAQEKALSDD